MDEFMIADLFIFELSIEDFISAEVIIVEFIGSGPTCPGTIVLVSITSFTVLSFLECAATFTL